MEYVYGREKVALQQTLARGEGATIDYSPGNTTKQALWPPTSREAGDVIQAGRGRR